jgi:hypothetical protein
MKHPERHTKQSPYFRGARTLLLAAAEAKCIEEGFLKYILAGFLKNWLVTNGRSPIALLQVQGGFDPSKTT